MPHPHLDMADLLERDQAPIARREGEIGKAGGVEPFRASAAGYDINRADILAHLRDCHAREQELQLLRGVDGRQADQPQPVLVQDECAVGTRSLQSRFT
jgi:hypothetical protein